MYQRWAVNSAAIFAVLLTVGGAADPAAAESSPVAGPAVAGSTAVESAVAGPAITESAVTESAVTESAVTESAVTESAVTVAPAVVSHAGVPSLAEQQLDPVVGGGFGDLAHLAQAVLTDRTAAAPGSTGMFRAIWARCIMLLIPDETRQSALVSV